MKRTHRCPKCNGRKIIRLPRLHDYQSSSIAAYVDHKHWAQTGKVSVRGKIEAYVCYRCGYTELFTKAPSKIPLDRIKGAKLLEGDIKVGPYR